MDEISSQKLAGDTQNHTRQTNGEFTVHLEDYNAGDGQTVTKGARPASYKKLIKMTQVEQTRLRDKIQEFNTEYLGLSHRHRYEQVILINFTYTQKSYLIQTVSRVQLETEKVLKNLQQKQKLAEIRERIVGWQSKSPAKTHNSNQHVIPQKIQLKQFIDEHVPLKKSNSLSKSVSSSKPKYSKEKKPRYVTMEQEYHEAQDQVYKQEMQKRNQKIKLDLAELAKHEKKFLHHLSERNSKNKTKSNSPEADERKTFDLKHRDSKVIAQQKAKREKIKQYELRRKTEMTETERGTIQSRHHKDSHIEEDRRKNPLKYLLLERNRNMSASQILRLRTSEVERLQEQILKEKGQTYLRQCKTQRSRTIKTEHNETEPQPVKYINYLPMVKIKPVGDEVDRIVKSKLDKQQKVQRLRLKTEILQESIKKRLNTIDKNSRIGSRNTLLEIQDKDMLQCLKAKIAYASLI